jgi:hypothetical protein
MQKAQMFSEDMIFALFILIFLFSLFFVVTDKVTSTITVTEDRSELDEVASIAINQLLESSGKPSNWNLLDKINETTVENIGIVSEKNVLDSEKVNKFVRLARGRLDSSSLAALWHFDEGSGSLIYDSSGNGNTGTLDNSPQWVNGRFGNASQLLLTSVQQAVINDSNSLDITGNLTIELWFKKEVLSGIGEFLLYKEEATFTYNDNEYFVSIGNDQKMYCFIANGATYQYVASVSTVQPNNWYHLACTANGTYFNIYINGVLENSTPQTLTPVPNNYHLYIGGQNNTALWRFNGTIDEVAIYSRAKSAEEIAEDYTDMIRTNDDYIFTKKLLGLNRAGYEFNFSISSLNGTIFKKVDLLPSATISNASYTAINNTAKIDRYALLNNSLVKLSLGVWSE